MGIINYTPRTWLAGEVVTGAEMNSEIRDPWSSIQSAWTAYTPVLTAPTTNPTLGTGATSLGTYMQIGKLIIGSFDISFGTSGFVAGSGVYEVSLPVAAPAGGAGAGTNAGSGEYVDASPLTTYPVVLSFQSTTTVRFHYNGGTTGVSAVAPVVPANNDKLHGTFTYQAQ
jgi:hypothetical protein